MLEAYNRGRLGGSIGLALTGLPLAFRKSCENMFLSGGTSMPEGLREGRSRELGKRESVSLIISPPGAVNMPRLPRSSADNASYSGVGPQEDQGYNCKMRLNLNQGDPLSLHPLWIF